MHAAPDRRLGVARWSLRGYVASVILVSAFGTLQVLLTVLGVELYFVGFLPAVFLAGLFAGWPAAVAAALLAFPCAWWGFMPPLFELGPLTPHQYEATKVFGLCSALLVMLSDLGHELLASDV
jgi:hypothetical protein